MATATLERSEGMAVLNQFPFRFEIVETERMFVDPSYQRGLTNFVKKIERDFNPALIQTLCLSERKDGRMAVIDGQTRMVASERLGYTALPALVYEGLSRADEARIFELMQTERRGITSWTRFRAALAAKSPEAIAIKDVAEATGWAVGPDTGQIRAVAALEWAFRQDEFTLERQLGIWHDAWSTAGHVPAAEHLRGMQHFLRNFPLDRDVLQDVDDEKLVRRLSLQTPGELSKRSASLREGGLVGARAKSMAQAIQLIYRKG